MNLSSFRNTLKLAKLAVRQRGSIAFLNSPIENFSVQSKFSLGGKILYSFSQKGQQQSEGGKNVQITAENAHQIIDSWVKKNKVVLFMKGTPANPQCGYSNFVVQLLKKYGLNEYKAVNILQNPVVRQQVKLYSKWPTYPQLYIDGELIGGSDILHQMHKDQSLHKLLEQKKLI